MEKENGNYRGSIRVVLGFFWDTGNENGNYYSGWFLLNPLPRRAQGLRFRGQSTGK